MFLNIVPTISHSATVAPASTANANKQVQNQLPTFGLILDENPLADFVELPEEALEGQLWFSNVLCGVLRGALEMVSARVHSLTYSPYIADIGSDASRGQVHLRCIARG